MRRPGARATVLAVLTVVVGLLSACTGSPSRPGGPTGPTGPAEPTGLSATVTQFRFQEGTRVLRAWVANDGRRTVRVTSATLVWSGFAFPTVTVPDPVTAHGQAAAFDIAYGEPRCAAAPTSAPTAVAVVDGRRVRLPLRVEDRGLLDRLHQQACDRRRLDQQASVSLRWSRAPVRLRGDLVLPGTLTVGPRPGATARVRVVGLGGSVLLDLATRRPGLLPVLAPRRGLRVPVVVGSSNRCDAHALGQSSQTFLISAYVRLPGRPAQRVVLVPTRAEQVRILAVVHRACAAP